MSPVKKRAGGSKAASGRKRTKASRKRTARKSSVKRSGAKARREAASRRRPARPKRTRAAASRASRKRAAAAKASKRVRPAAPRAGTRRSRVKTTARAKRPALHLVRKGARRRARPAPPPAFPQTSGATAKQRLLFELVRAHTAVTAAIQGLLAGGAERAMGEGKWSVRETVLHLATRDRIRLREMEAALRGVPPSWREIGEDEQSRINERDLATLRHLPWDEAVRLLHSTRRELMESIESVPEEPAEVWSEAHPFGWMMQRLPQHDRHHADAIKRWRAEAGA